MLKLKVKACCCSASVPKSCLEVVCYADFIHNFQFVNCLVNQKHNYLKIKASIMSFAHQLENAFCLYKKVRMLFRVVNFSKHPNLWLHNVVTLWYHVDNHALSHITDSTDSS